MWRSPLKKKLKVKCIDVSNKYGAPHSEFVEHMILTLGQIYEVQTSLSGDYFIAGHKSSFDPSRFIVLSENHCPQCGEKH